MNAHRPTIGLGHAFIAAGTAGEQRTELARKVAPPGRAPRYFVLGLACFGLLLVATGWPLLGGTLAGVFGLATAEFVRQNKVLHPVRSARYERKWICLACGHEWIAGEP